MHITSPWRDSALEIDDNNISIASEALPCEIYGFAHLWPGFGCASTTFAFILEIVVDVGLSVRSHADVSRAPTGCRPCDSREHDIEEGVMTYGFVPETSLANFKRANIRAHSPPAVCNSC